MESNRNAKHHLKNSATDSNSSLNNNNNGAGSRIQAIKLYAPKPFDLPSLKKESSKSNHSLQGTPNILRGNSSTGWGSSRTKSLANINKQLDESTEKFHSERTNSSHATSLKSQSKKNHDGNNLVTRTENSIQEGNTSNTTAITSGTHVSSMKQTKIVQSVWNSSEKLSEKISQKLKHEQEQSQESSTEKRTPIEMKSSFKVSKQPPSIKSDKINAWYEIDGDDMDYSQIPTFNSQKESSGSFDSEEESHLMTENDHMQNKKSRMKEENNNTYTINEKIKNTAVHIPDKNGNENDNHQRTDRAGDSNIYERRKKSQQDKADYAPRRTMHPDDHRSPRQEFNSTRQTSDYPVDDRKQQPYSQFDKRTYSSGDQRKSGANNKNNTTQHQLESSNKSYREKRPNSSLSKGASYRDNRDASNGGNVNHSNRLSYHDGGSQDYSRSYQNDPKYFHRPNIPLSHKNQCVNNNRELCDVILVATEKSRVSNYTTGHENNSDNIRGRKWNDDKNHQHVFDSKEDCYVDSHSLKDHQQLKQQQHASYRQMENNDPNSRSRVNLSNFASTSRSAANNIATDRSWKRPEQSQLVILSSTFKRSEVQSTRESNRMFHNIQWEANFLSSSGHTKVSDKNLNIEKKTRQSKDKQSSDSLSHGKINTLSVSKKEDNTDIKVSSDQNDNLEAFDAVMQRLKAAMKKTPGLSASSTQSKNQQNTPIKNVHDSSSLKKNRTVSESHSKTNGKIPHVGSSIKRSLNINRCFENKNVMKSDNWRRRTEKSKDDVPEQTTTVANVDKNKNQYDRKIVENNDSKKRSISPTPVVELKKKQDEVNNNDDNTVLENNKPIAEKSPIESCVSTLEKERTRNQDDMHAQFLETRIDKERNPKYSGSQQIDKLSNPGSALLKYAAISIPKTQESTPNSISKTKPLEASCPDTGFTSSYTTANIINPLVANKNQHNMFANSSNVNTIGNPVNATSLSNVDVQEFSKKVGANMRSVQTMNGPILMPIYSMPTGSAPPTVSIPTNAIWTQDAMYPGLASNGSHVQYVRFGIPQQSSIMPANLISSAPSSAAPVGFRTIIGGAHHHQDQNNHTAFGIPAFQTIPLYSQPNEIYGNFPKYRPASQLTAVNLPNGVTMRPIGPILKFSGPGVSAQPITRATGHYSSQISRSQVNFNSSYQNKSVGSESRHHYYHQSSSNNNNNNINNSNNTFSNYSKPNTYHQSNNYQHHHVQNHSNFQNMFSSSSSLSYQNNMSSGIKNEELEGSGKNKNGVDSTAKFSLNNAASSIHGKLNDSNENSYVKIFENLSLKNKTLAKENHKNKQQQHPNHKQSDITIDEEEESTSSQNTCKPNSSLKVSIRKKSEQ